MTPAPACGTVLFMPELPEVEHAARTLSRWLRGRRVRRAEADAARTFRGSDPRAFVRAMRGRTLVDVQRRGKLLLLRFDAGIGMLCHLGMTGKWIRRRPGEAAPSHTRARLVLDDGSVLHYCDLRLFGRIALHPASALEALPEVRALGPDPLREGVDAERLARALSRTRRSVKVALMDGRVVAGVGNIQATEALFLARVHPARIASTLSREEIRRVARGIEASIARTLRALREPIVYVEEDPGSNPFLVYGRRGAPCPVCRTPLEKIRLGGRGTIFCPRCQPRTVRRSKTRRGRVAPAR